MIKDKKICINVEPMKPCSHCPNKCASEKCDNGYCETVINGNNRPRLVCSCPSVYCKCKGIFPPAERVDEQMIFIYSGEALKALGE